MCESLFSKIQNGDFPIPNAAATLGAQIIEVSRGLGTIEIEFEGKPAFTNPVGNIQGGFLAAMLDDTMGPALAATLKEDEFAPTLELSIQFIASARVGKLVGYGRIVSKGQNVCFLEGELKQDGKLVAKANATALIRQIRR
ncbi:PaaI family thioesterase [Microbulbifer spongiae]|uniref:PaaI family thioesterase n=1 Tax=Microbulbifer spongiae TaxID=2944933 RepID=A0ABY9ECC3_9GAMM|nr:PaaI family thioesterase [Microbulbifer sp. MI-G]WKD50292.1 PaaI family thioesterase [Microbulbifer sp. MI-G]